MMFVILVYWLTITHIPEEVLEQIRKLCFKLLWRGKTGTCFHWKDWSFVVKPKDIWGWGIKEL